MFKNKLKIKVFTELMRHNTIIKNLNDLIKTTIKINNKLYQLQIMTRLSRINKYYYNHSTGHYIIKKNHKPSSIQYKDSMDLNVIQKKKAGKKGGFQKKIREYYNYYKTGYITYNYYIKKNII